MLKKHPLLVALALIGVAFATYYAVIAVIGPHYAEVCSYTEKGEPYGCRKWDSVAAFVFNALGLLDRHNGIVAALSGVAVAFFTAVLWRSTDKLWQSAVDQGNATERLIKAAENSAKAADARNRPWLKIHVERTGPLTFDDLEGVSIGTVVHIENVGTSPAIKVKVSTGLSVVSKKVVLDGTGDEGVRFAVNKAQISTSERITYDPGVRSDADWARVRARGDVVFPGENRPVQATNWAINTGELGYVLSQGDGSEEASVFLAASVEYYGTTGWGVTTVVYIVERETGDEASDGHFWNSAAPAKYDSDIKLRKLQIHTTAT